MPELPEVETIRRGLEKRIINKQIKKVHVLCEKSFTGNPKYLQGQKITHINRKGKMLLIKLENGMFMTIHLRMTGQLIYEGKDKFAAGHPDDNFYSVMPSRHTRVQFEFSDHSNLYFNDQRKFGFVKIVDELGLREDKFLQKLAKEPWDITPKEFYQNLQKHKNQCIKASILDQSVIAGVGNIYADEALFMSKIFPGTITKQLNEVTTQTLLKNIQIIMQRSIDSGGSTMKDYRKSDGSKGNYLEKFAQVFRKENQPCPICQNSIQKIRIAGRGTHFCPHCQPPQISVPHTTKRQIHN